jgi:hypothetical protein
MLVEFVIEKNKKYIFEKAAVPDQNGPQTPGINNLFFETAMWHVDVPHTNTIR